MNDLHDEIKMAFAKELAQYPAASVIREEAMQAVARHQPRRPVRLEWIAVAAAILVTVAILLSLVANRLFASQIIPSTPPPAGVKVFYVIDPQHANAVIAYDWSGRPRGTVHLATPLATSSTAWAAPDGSSFVRMHPDASAEWLDRTGVPVAGSGMSMFGWRSYMWSADSQGVCRLGVNGDGDWQLSTIARTGTSRVVKVLGPDITEDPTLFLAACSFADDRVLITRETNTPPVQTELISVALSTGAVTVAEDAKPVGYEASPTGSVIAENGVGPGNSLVTRIHALGVDVPAVQLPEEVSEFSGDGTMAFTVDGSALEVIDWKHQRTVWHYSASLHQEAYYFGEPGGARFAVGITPPLHCPCSAFPPMTVTIVNPDGSTIPIRTGGMLLIPQLPT